MNKKLLNLVKKNNVQKEVYCSEVNSKINKKYKFGEEHAIIRKTIYLLLEDLLEKDLIDLTKYNEFIKYYNEVETHKAEVKSVLENNEL